MQGKTEIDLSVDLIKDTLSRLGENLRQSMKDKRLFRQEPLKDADVVAKYLEIKEYPDVETRLRQEYPEEILKLEKKISRITGGQI